jgi:hypothetical protein
MKIERVDPTPEDYLLRQAREDDARVTGKKLIEPVHHYRNTETGQLYYSLYGAIGWPNIISDKPKATNRPGYLAIVGIIKGKRPAESAYIQLLAESESHSIGVLLDEMIRLRAEYGFGLHSSLLSSWYGDQERFVMEIAARNDTLVKFGGDRQAILINTPLDFYDVKAFDLYVRSLTDALSSRSQRLYYGGNEILKNRVGEYSDKDPVVVGMGGLIYSLVLQMPWMDTLQENAFNVEEG